MRILNTQQSVQSHQRDGKTQKGTELCNHLEHKKEQEGSSAVLNKYKKASHGAFGINYYASSDIDNTSSKIAENKIFHNKATPTNGCKATEDGFDV